MESQSETDESDPEPTTKGKKKVGAINASKMVEESESSEEDSDSNPPKSKVANSTVNSTPKALSKPKTVITAKQQTPAKPSTSQDTSSESSDSDSEPVKASPQKKAQIVLKPKNGQSSSSSESSDSEDEPVKASPQKKALQQANTKPKNGISSSSESDESSEEEPVKPSSPPKKINSSVLSSPQKDGKALPVWALNQKLYKNEPPKPPK